MKFREFQNYEPRTPAHVFVFVCGEDLLVDESKPVWRRIFGSGDGQDWEFERISAREFEGISESDLLGMALAPPLFGPSRALFVLEAGKVGKKRMAVAEEIAALRTSSLKIVFIAESRRSIPRGGDRLPRVEIDALRSGDTIRWLRDRYAVQPEVARYLVETVGTELRILAAEMEKLATYVRADRAIELRDVDALTLRTEQFSPFDLDDALFGGDYPKAVRVAEAMLEEGVEPLIVLSRLARVWRQLVIGKSLGPRVTVQEGARAASVPGWKASEFRSACERTSVGRLLEGCREIPAADKRLKTSAPAPAVLFDVLLWKLMKGGVSRPRSGSRAG